MAFKWSSDLIQHKTGHAEKWGFIKQCFWNEIILDSDGSDRWSIGFQGLFGDLDFRERFRSCADSLEALGTAVFASAAFFHPRLVFFWGQKEKSLSTFCISICNVKVQSNNMARYLFNSTAILHDLYLRLIEHLYIFPFYTFVLPRYKYSCEMFYNSTTRGIYLSALKPR